MVAKPKPLAVMGNYKDPDALLQAVVEIRKAGYRHFEVYTPYPIHGLEQAMGLQRSRLSYISLFGGLAGLGTALLLQWWTGAVDYPLNIGGKPFFAWEFSVPVNFELTVLFTAFATVIGFLWLCRLPRWYSDYQHDAGFRAATDDTFVVSIESRDPLFSIEETRALLERLGAESVRLVEA
ncbi:MAG: DUF3341 domain-containing protein [Candidatus Kapabacteria bacterium]|nr:DUF3341 domain-containing protein [Candidatus Kapabacteria bacterium]MDW8012362.1 DUF3341 domain-containing protein [Bacteroidota bacterium]